jgi:hypothetical protein
MSPIFQWNFAEQDGEKAIIGDRGETDPLKILLSTILQGIRTVKSYSEI